MPSLERVAAVARRHPAIYHAARQGVVRVRGALPPRTVEGLPGRVHRNDLMFDAGRAHAAEAYAHIGRSAVRACGDALETAGLGWSDVSTALDFGCGHGRVARHLAAALPAGGRLTVCDLDPEAVRFCAREFSARGVVGGRDLGRVVVGRHALVWAGSVATHLPEAAWLAWIDLIARSLEPGGVFVFTSHGPACIDRDFSPEWVERRTALRADLARTGYAYVGYSYLPDGGYGLSAQTTERIEADLAAVGLTRLLHRTGGWEYQDVHAVRRVVDH